MIPKKLIQFWHDKETLPKLIAEAMECTQRSHPDFEIILANDEFMHRFIGYHYGSAILSLYKRNTIPSSRSDMARLMLLYEFGGVYIDTSFAFNKSFGEFFDETVDLILVLRDDMPRYDNCPEKAHVINGIIAVHKKSDFMKCCLDNMLRYLISGSQNHHVNIATGPDIINSALRKRGHRYIVKKLSMKFLKFDFLTINTVAGVSNQWPVLQRDGIIAPEFYKQNSKRFEKSWVLRNKLFHFSFSFLSTK